MRHGREDLGTAPTIAQYEVCPRRWLTSMMPCATLRLRNGEEMVAQGRVGQDWAALGGLAKVPKRGKISVV